MAAKELSLSLGAAVPALVLILTLPSPGLAEPLRDGKNFDPGAAMDRPAEGAPPELERMTDILGTWDVAYQSFAADSLVREGKGRSRITLMNRGHAIQERFHLPDMNGTGQDLDVLGVLIYNPTNKIWMFGSVNSNTENIVLYSGDLQEEGLLLKNSERRLGGAGLVHSRWSLAKEDDGFRVRVEESGDGGRTWSPTLVKRYTPSGEPFFPISPEPYGTPAPGLPPEARQFDFLAGEWNTEHDMTLPTGQVHFPVEATAVYTLNGHAVVEFNWYDVDPRLPDAATTLVRIYNRAMRRWECLYVNNRFNSLLHFGGVQEGNRIVLHLFGANTADVPISYWIFEDIRPDSYRWHAETSRDGGRTFSENWVIEAVRKPAPAEED